MSIPAAVAKLAFFLAFVMTAAPWVGQPLLAARQSETFGPPRRDGATLRVVFDRARTITITPLKQRSEYLQRCAVKIEAAGSAPQIVDTLPGDGAPATEEPPTVCLELQAVGRLPAPRGTDRVGLIYRAFTGWVLRSDNSHDDTLILYRTTNDGRWRRDTALERRTAGATKIAQMRRLVR